jgi:hypothetical protein
MKVDIQHSAFRSAKSTFAKDKTIHKISTIINGVTNIISNDGSEFSRSDKLHISDGVLCKKASNKSPSLRRNRKLLLIGDSHVKGCAVRFKNMINDNFEVCGLVKPGSGASILMKSIND